MEEAGKQIHGADDFHLVIEALQSYTRSTGREPLLTGGWEVEDPAIGPPVDLVKRLLSIAPQPGYYAYGKDFHQAREKTAEVFREGVSFGNHPIQPDQVVVLQNSSQGLLLALTVLREQGVHHAVIAAPTYYATMAICRHLEMEITLVPASDYLTGALDLPRLAQALEHNQSVLILTNPAYSVGVEYPPEQLQALFPQLPAHTWVLLDETRLGLHWQQDRPWYPGHFSERTLILRSPSKIFLLNGLKTSFLLGPARVMRQVEQLGDVLVGSAAGNAEAIALAYLDAWQWWMEEAQQGRRGAMLAWKQGVVSQLQRNRDVVGTTLEELGFRLSPVNSGPYLLAAAMHLQGRGLESTVIAHQYGVLLLTSNYFYHGSDTWWGFRVNLCGNSEQIIRAFRRIFTSQALRSISSSR